VDVTVPVTKCIGKHDEMSALDEIEQSLIDTDKYIDSIKLCLTNLRQLLGGAHSKERIYKCRIIYELTMLLKRTGNWRKYNYTLLMTRVSGSSPTLNKDRNIGKMLYNHPDIFNAMISNAWKYNVYGYMKIYHYAIYINLLDSTNNKQKQKQ